MNFMQANILNLNGSSSLIEFNVVRDELYFEHKLERTVFFFNCIIESLLVVKY
jgi:hypothetical protein